MNYVTETPIFIILLIITSLLSQVSVTAAQADKNQSRRSYLPSNDLFSFHANMFLPSIIYETGITGGGIVDQKEEHMFNLAGPLDQQLATLTVDRHTNYDLSKPLNLLLK